MQIRIVTTFKKKQVAFVTITENLVMPPVMCNALKKKII
jgi:hypothetical protein